MGGYDHIEYGYFSLRKLWTKMLSGKTISKNR